MLTRTAGRGMAARPALAVPAAALAGIVLVAWDLGTRTAPALAADDLARVGAVTIPRSALRTLDEAAAAVLGGGQRVDPAALRDRLVDEELLIQRGLELDLVRRDAAVRAALVGATTTAALAGVADTEPSTADLAALLAASPDTFAQPAQVEVVRMRFPAPAPDGLEVPGPVEVPGATELPGPVEVPGAVEVPGTAEVPGATELSDAAGDRAAAGAGARVPAAQARAAQAAARLAAGEPFAAVAAELAGPDPFPPPRSPVSLERLAGFIGRDAAAAVADLPVGAVVTRADAGSGDPAGWLLLRVERRVPGRVPELAEVLPAVRAEWRRRRERAELDTYLAWLRERTPVVLGAGAGGSDAAPAAR